MAKQQLAVLWVVAVLVSAVLFYSGIGKPYLAERRYASEREPQVMGNPLLGPDALKRTSSERERWLENRKRDTARNYYTGAVAPILLLGACAFLSTLKPKRQSQ